MKLSEKKKAKLVRLSDNRGIIDALAIDQRGAMKKLFSQAGQTATAKDIIDFKKIVSEYLTPFTSAILLDPEYGLPAAEMRADDAGLLLAYEETGYEATVPGRLPDLLPNWSAKRIAETGADGVKFLLYYDVDEGDAVNDIKHAFVERLGNECLGEEIPFFMEIVTYDKEISDPLEYAKLKPHKVLDGMMEFAKAKYNVDVLKVEVPVNMQYVQGYAEGEILHSKEEAEDYFRVQSACVEQPFIFLSAGVSAELFQQTLIFAKKAGSQFNGVLCGRATWAGGVEAFVKNGEKGAVDWVLSQGKQNVDELNAVLKQTATPWMERVSEIVTE